MCLKAAEVASTLLYAKNIGTLSVTQQSITHSVSEVCDYFPI